MCNLNDKIVIEVKSEKIRKKLLFIGSKFI